MTTEQLRALADSLLTGAKVNLQNDGVLYPIVFVISTSREGGVEIVPHVMKFHTREEKAIVYAQLWQEVLPKNPEAIVMLNDARMKMFPKDARQEWTGHLKELRDAGDTSVKDCIIIGVYPRGTDAFLLMTTYQKNGERFVFDPTVTQDGGTDLAGALGPNPWLRQGNLKYGIGGMR